MLRWTLPIAVTSSNWSLHKRCAFFCVNGWSCRTEFQKYGPSTISWVSPAKLHWNNTTWTIFAVVIEVSNGKAVFSVGRHARSLSRTFPRSSSKKPLVFFYKLVSCHKNAARTGLTVYFTWMLTFLPVFLQMKSMFTVVQIMVSSARWYKFYQLRNCLTINQCRHVVVKDIHHCSFSKK